MINSTLNVSNLPLYSSLRRGETLGIWSYDKEKVLDRIHLILDATHFLNDLNIGKILKIKNTQKLTHLT